MTTRGMRAEAFLCPIAPRRNHSVELRALEDDGLRFCERFALMPSPKALQKVASIKVGELTAQTYPDADEGLSHVCNQLLLWFFICDDQFDERALGANPYKLQKICENFLRILSSGNERAAISPLSRALLELRNRMWTLGNEPWRERFIASMTLYLEGCLREAENRERSVTPDFDEYQQIRRASVGTYPCFDLIELSIEPRIPEALIDSPALAMIRDLRDRYHRLDQRRGVVCQGVGL
jgi:5-epi-alpha-selinene synthase